MNAPKRPASKAKKSRLISLLFGVVYIAATLIVLLLLLFRASPPQKLVCEKTREGTGLTRFGSCHTE